MNSNCKDSIHTSAGEGVYDIVATSVRDKLHEYEF